MYQYWISFLKNRESNSGIEIEKSEIVPSLIIIHLVTFVTAAVSVFIFYIPYHISAFPRLKWTIALGLEHKQYRVTEL
jgi:hypothetical protein